MVGLEDVRGRRGAGRLKQLTFFYDQQQFMLRARGRHLLWRITDQGLLRQVADAADKRIVGQRHDRAVGRKRLPGWQQAQGASRFPPQISQDVEGIADIGFPTDCFSQMLFWREVVEEPLYGSDRAPVAMLKLMSWQSR
jgi:hypothetical protein